ncbi:recombinase family protein [Listeria booriae]|uniref:recombinase family protein n=1 Tax=Listeria booriae TaxID=1552123 RepID=UPI002892ED3F|nr:recombinase family protein [Listeria booriae]
MSQMDRLGRNTKKMLELIEYLESREVHLVILNLGVDTSPFTRGIEIASPSKLLIT